MNDITLKKSIGEQISDMRYSCGHDSIKAFAAVVGMDRMKFRNIENGEANPTIDTLCKIARAMDCDIEITFVSRNPKLVKVAAPPPRPKPSGKLKTTTLIAKLKKLKPKR